METPQAADVILGWFDILKIVVASGLVAAVLGWFKDGYFKRRDEARNAKYSAIGVVAKLDLYALQSRANVRDYYDHVQQLDPHADYLNWPSCLHPELQIADTEIRSLNPEHASDLAWIATEKALANQHLRLIDEQAYTPLDVYHHEADVVGYFGFEAHLLAEKLRRTFGLPSFGSRWEADDDFIDLLECWTNTKAERSRLKRQRQANPND